MERLTRKLYSEMGEVQQTVFDKIADGRSGVTDGRIGGPFDVWMLNPELAETIDVLGKSFRYGLSIDRRYIEIAILVTGAFWTSQYEWFAHEKMATDAGVPAEIIKAVKAGDRPEFADECDAVAHDLSYELHRMHHIGDEIYQRAVNAFGEIGVAELINLCGFYTMVAMSLNTFRISIPNGEKPPFEN
jgi:4-carboxymuconolactone decarboxylase